MVNFGPFRLFLIISYIGNNENPPITDEICWSLHVQYCGVPLYQIFSSLLDHLPFLVQFFPHFYGVTPVVLSKYTVATVWLFYIVLSYFPLSKFSVVPVLSFDMRFRNFILFSSLSRGFIYRQEMKANNQEMTISSFNLIFYS